MKSTSRQVSDNKYKTGREQDMAKKTMHNLFYDSVKEFIDDVSSPPKEWKSESNKEGWEDLERSRKGSFNGSFKLLVDKFSRHDVKKEASVLAGVMSEINYADFTERSWEYRQRLEEGDIIDVNRYLDGHERFWCGVRRAWRTKQVVRVYCGFGGNCNRTPEELAVCGAVCVTLCEILEGMGIGVELWGVATAGSLFDNYDDGETLVKLKASDEFADLGMVNFITGTDYVFRNAVFRSLYKLAERDGMRCRSSLGRMKVPSAEDIGLCEEEARTAIIVPQLFAIEPAKEWLKGLLDKLPGRMEGEKKEDAE